MQPLNVLLIQLLVQCSPDAAAVAATDAAAAIVSRGSDIPLRRSSRTSHRPSYLRD